MVPARFSDGVSVLDSLGLPSEVVSELSEIDAATNDRKMADAVTPRYWAWRTSDWRPLANIVNAAFCHPSPTGSRFNRASRGAWYAGREIETSVAEVAYHKRLFLMNAHFKGLVNSEYQDFAPISAETSTN